MGTIRCTNGTDDDGVGWSQPADQHKGITKFDGGEELNDDDVSID